MKPTLYSICFDKDQIGEVKSPMVPFDNTENLRPELREYQSFKRIMTEGYATELYGVFGPRAEQKLRYSGDTIYSEIVANPLHDVYLFNHARIQSVLFLNVWEQGEYFHPGISKVVRYALDRNGYDPSVVDKIMYDKQMCYCSYFVAKKAFWNDYMHFVDIIVNTLNALPDELATIYHGSANYARDTSLGMFPFIVERLFSTYLKLNENDYKVYVKPYDYSLYTTENNFINHFSTLHRIKESWDSFDEWHYLRTETLLKHPELLHLD